MTVFVVSVATACLVSGICSLFEAVLLSLTPAEVAEISLRHPRTGRIWNHFKNDVSDPIAAILIVNTASHTLGASIGGAACERVFGERSVIVFSIIFTYVMLQFTEILPKTLGVAWKRTLAVILGKPLYLATKILKPVIWFIHLVNRPFEAKPDNGGNSVALDEITTLAGMAHLAREINRPQERIIKDTPKLSKMTVADVMIPADEVLCLSAGMTIHDGVRAGAAYAHTRFPVTESGEPDLVIGYVNFKEIARGDVDGNGDWVVRDLLRPVHFFAPDTNAAELLRRFVDERVRLAIVRGADGVMLGLVTLEDLIEELVGELEDEVDGRPVTRGTRRRPPSRIIHPRPAPPPPVAVASDAAPEKPDA